jgi:hypothetical protein
MLRGKDGSPIIGFVRKTLKKGTVFKVTLGKPCKEIKFRPYGKLRLFRILAENQLFSEIEKPEKEKKC